MLGCLERRCLLYALLMERKAGNSCPKISYCTKDRQWGAWLLQKKQLEQTPLTPCVISCLSVENALMRLHPGEVQATLTTCKTLFLSPPLQQLWQKYMPFTRPKVRSPLLSLWKELFVAGNCSEQKYMAISHILNHFEEATENSTTACSNFNKFSRKSLTN